MYLKEDKGKNGIKKKGEKGKRVRVWRNITGTRSVDLL
jgi:hypothetical protein